MELPIQVARVRPRDGFARGSSAGSAGTSDGGGVVSTSGAASARSDQRIRETRLFDPSDQFGKRLCLRCQEKFVELALGIADLVENVTQLAFDHVSSVRRRLRDHDRLQLRDRRQQLRGVGVPVPPRVFSEEGAAALAPRKRLAESLIVVLVGRAGRRKSLARWFRPAWAIPAQPFINNAG